MELKGSEAQHNTMQLLDIESDIQVDLQLSLISDFRTPHAHCTCILHTKLIIDGQFKKEEESEKLLTVRESFVQP